jgi:pilus assembly protein Flp/PilA
MTMLRTFATKFVGEEEGASLAEYGLLLALIAVICVTAITLLGSNVSTMFSQIGKSV